MLKMLLPPQEIVNFSSYRGLGSLFLDHKLVLTLRVANSLIMAFLVTEVPL